MVLVDSITRLLPGVLGNPNSLNEESFSDALKIKNCKLKIDCEYPQYTRPEDYNGWKVPEVLLSGDHKKLKLGNNLLPRTKLHPQFLLSNLCV